MRKISCIVVIAVLFLLSSPNPCLANGTSYYFVTIIAVDVRSDGTFLIDITAPLKGSPACARVTTRMTGDSTTAAGKFLLQAALASFLSGKQVYLDGTGLCTQYPNIESLYRLY